MLLALATAAVAIGCAADKEAPTAAATEDVGTFALPLVSHASGHTYRLRNVSVLIYGPQQYLYLSDQGGPSLPALSTTLSTGTYSSNLAYGWALERDDGSGAFLPVSATLSSNPSVAFTILNGATTTVSYEFQTDGVIVKIGSGQLQITATIDEVAAVCTPFGADCGEGAWCPPTSLTGMPRACLAAGTTPVGAPCGSPTACVANASCFDLGAGPVCAPLCTPEQFNGACGDPGAGNTCQSVGAEYGICRPATVAP